MSYVDNQINASIKNDLEPKQVKQANMVISKPKDTCIDSHLVTQVTYAPEKFKEKDVPLTWQRLYEYLSLHGGVKEYGQDLKGNLMSHEKVSYEKFDGKEKDLFSFRPIHNIRSVDDMLRFLQYQPTAQALSVKDLKEGWHGALDAINNLEKQGKLSVIRHKERGSAQPMTK